MHMEYHEENERKNALVKVRLCPEDSYKLNYHHKKKEVTNKRTSNVSRKSSKKYKKKHRKRRRSSDSSESDSHENEKRLKHKLEEDKKEVALDKNASEIWSAPIQIEQEKSREEDFSEYLEELFL